MNTSIFGKGVFADPAVDTAFKRIFGTEEFKEATKGLISDIIGKQVKEVRFKSQELLPELPDGKKCIVDVLCQDQDGNWFNVEMQRAKQEHFLQRLVFYSSRLISTTGLQRGVIDYDLKDYYVISFINFPIKDIINPEMVSHPYAHHFATTEISTDSRIKLPGSPEFYVFDLSAFNKKPEDIDNMRDYWLSLLVESKDMEAVPEFAKGNGAVEAYFNASQMASFSKEELDRYTKDMMNEWDYANSIAFAKKEGRAEGKAEGIAEGHAKGVAEGKAEIAKTMLSKGYSAEVISECTGLSSEQIAAL